MIKFLVALPIFSGDKGFNHKTILVSAKSIEGAVEKVCYLKPNDNIGEIKEVCY